MVGDLGCVSAKHHGECQTGPVVPAITSAVPENPLVGGAHPEPIALPRVLRDRVRTLRSGSRWGK